MTNLRNMSFVATAVLTIAVLALLFKHALFADRPVYLMAQGLGALLMLWARLTLRSRSFHITAEPTEGPLITTGPYHFVRHPIYVALLIFVCAGVASRPSLVNVSMAAMAAAAIVVRMVTEELTLADRYPGYAAYAAVTKRLLPFVF